MQMHGSPEGKDEDVDYSAMDPGYYEGRGEDAEGPAGGTAYDWMSETHVCRCNIAGADAASVQRSARP